jgi:hypothetical protein
MTTEVRNLEVEGSNEPFCRKPRHKSARKKRGGGEHAKEVLEIPPSALTLFSRKRLNPERRLRPSG